MALSDIELFLRDVFQRYDPSLNTAEGSRIQTEVIQPILGRIGPDPFDNDIETFVKDRLTQSFPTLSLTQTSALNDTLVSPMRVLLEPIVREIKLVKLRQSVANTESLADDEVDALMSNFFEARKSGGYARGTIRVNFTAPVTVAFTMLQVAATRSGLRFIPSSAQTITKDVMLLNREGSEFYVDVSYVSEKRGDEYNVDRNEILTISNLSAATRVRNINRFTAGLPRETSATFVGRVESKLSDRTLTVSRGIISEITDNYSAVRRIQVVGFRDSEMQRDVVRGGGLGAVLAALPGSVPYGTATTVADGTGSSFTQRISAPGPGVFTTYICSAGSDPTGFYITLVNGGVFVDVAVLSVISATDITVDYPGVLTIGASVSWAIRRRELTISDIPGGITLPDTQDGTLLVRPDEVHIGGKTDIYLAGGIATESVAIDGIADEKPLARGIQATLTVSDVVVLNMTAPTAAKLVSDMADGFYSLILDTGADAGSYDIRSATVSVDTVVLRVSAEMTTPASNILWRIVDEINVELTEPKDIKLDAADLSMIDGNPVVTTASSTNFTDANIQVNDILRVDADNIGGDYTITAVGAVTLQVDPTPTRTGAGLKYIVYRPTGIVRAPVVRVTSIELLDSGGAPNGVIIPYREPVATIARGFQNEGSGVEFADYPLSIGLVSKALAATTNLNTLDLRVNFADASKVYMGSSSQYVVTFQGAALTPQQICNQINSCWTGSMAGTWGTHQVFASVITYNGLSYIGIYSPEQITVYYSGSANTALGFVADKYGRYSTNSQIRLPASYTPRVGDLVEFVDGNNAGGTRILRGIHHLADGTDALPYTVLVGPGTTDEALVPPGASYLPLPIHEVATLRPDVGHRIRAGRPSVGSARVYFMDPTSAEFRYMTAEFSALVGTTTVLFRPDPENDRILQPAPPLTDLPWNGVTSLGTTVTTFGDASVDFQALNIRPGDLLDVLYQPIISTGVIPASSAYSETLILRLDANPWITISLSTTLTNAEVVSAINTAVGEDIASLGTVAPNVDKLILKAASSLITISDDSSTFALDTLLLDGASRSTEHASSGTYVIAEVRENSLLLSEFTYFTISSPVTDTAYRLRRNVQRVSSTEMNAHVDATGLYYVDVEMLSLLPGDVNNIPGEISMTATAVVADGYSLSTSNPTLSYSRAEKLYASFSRSILLVGSSDSPSEYVQLSQQNVQVSYDRSQAVDDVQSFCDSDNHRVINEEILVRHLLPHYVDLGWRYVGGESEISMRTAIGTMLEAIEANEELEVIDITRVLTSRGATSVYSLAPDLASGRTAPVMVVVYHDIDRNVRAEIVKDFVKTSRTQRFIAGDLAIVRAAPGGIR